ncbi:MAG TPA: hypothetical protein VN771_04830, partial [Candidatus Baltobacteraceae bacterium]|nr:hypothetical protein [Candidatus Baltobacteraceae bacterium]
RSTQAELAAADASAHQAMLDAVELGHVALQSAALDAIGSLAQLRGDYATTAEVARQRLAFGDRLSIAERIDASCMVAWADVLGGDLAEAIAVCDSVARVVHPGQATNWALHLMSWRTVAAMLHGDWDAALQSVERARALWVELERVAAGYSTRGFVAALEICRARRDDAGVTRWREVLDEIHGAFDARALGELQRAVAVGDPEAVAGLLGPREITSVGIEVTERALSFLCDQRVLPEPTTVDRLHGLMPPQARMVIAQLDRVRGLRTKEAASFEAALVTLRAAGARPAIGRVEIELGRLNGDPALVASGAEILAGLGDVDQLDRYGLSG